MNQKPATQVYEIAKIPVFKDQQIRIMPDVHWGDDVCIGFTTTYSDKIIPNIVGTDVGCGMLAINLGQIKLDLPKIDAVINEFVRMVAIYMTKPLFRCHYSNNYVCKKMIKELSIYEKAIGTLGGGNHFIEISKDENNETYLIIHTGSRNLGNGVATYYQDLAFSSLMGKEKLKQEKQALIQAYKKASATNDYWLKH